LLRAYAKAELPIGSHHKKNGISTGWRSDQADFANVADGGQPPRFTSEDLSLSSSTSFRYVWFKIKEVLKKNEKCAALSELKVYEVKPPHTYDPETEIETPL
jgi:hypothetical protein